jgi:hypothetical protein
MSSRIDELVASLVAGGSLADADLLTLAQTADILTLGMAADDVRQRAHGGSATYVRVYDVAITDRGADLALPSGAGELRVLVPFDPFDAAVSLIKLVAARAGRVPVTAGSLADAEACASRAGRPLVDMLRAVRQAGAVAVARDAGLDVARVSVHRATDAAARVALLRRAADLQHSLGWLRSFAPLARAGDPASPSTGYDDVRQVGLARLVCDNIPSIQVDWSLYGPKLAQVALTMGADDLDAVSAVDDAPDGRRRGPVEEVRRNISAAALTPVERDGAWRRIGE